MVKWILRSSNIGYSSCCVSFRRRSYLFGIRKIEDFLIGWMMRKAGSQKTY